MKKNFLSETVTGLVMVICTLLLLFGAIEVYVRVFVDDGMQFDLEMWKYARDLKQVSPDPLLGHEHVPGTHAHLMGVDVSINSQGLRDREIPIAREPGVGRILMLGNSVTFGWGVTLDQTFSKQLEKMFDDSGQKMEVIDAGVGNYNTIMETEYFLTKGYKFQPDLVVLNFSMNDARPVPGHGYNNAFVRHSEALVFLAGRIDNALRYFGVKREWRDYYLALYNNPKGWDDAKAAFHRLVEYCRAHSIRVMLVNWPDMHNVEHYPLQMATDKAHAEADAEHVPFVDLLPAYQGHPSSTLWVTVPDPHPNALAHKLSAEYLFPIVKKVLAEPAPAS